jgi:hypothetical protein
MAPARLVVLTPREASIFACLVDTVAGPEPLLPPVAGTDCAFFFDRWMAAAPKPNAYGMRAMLFALELMPLALGYGRRLRALPVTDRVRFVEQLDRSPNRHVRQLTKLLKGAAFLAYYGDDGVMLQIGYDAGANVARGRALRAAEGRP